MFPARYFCRRFFAARYWPKVGSGAAPAPTTLAKARSGTRVLETARRPAQR